MNLSARFNKFKHFFSKESLSRFKSKGYWWKLIKNNRRKIFLSIGIILLILILIPVFTYIYFAGDLKDKQSITSYNKTGLTLTDKDGKTFFTFFHPKSVTYIPISDMPKTLQEAVITAEDRDFYKNPGFSISGMTRAFVRNLIAGKIVEGGSTISQELVKNALLNSNRNFFRKYQELVLATELNRRFNKQDILEMYLNSVYFGEGAFGIENAAQTYFGIPAKELSLAQSSLLISLLPAPSAYSPISNDPEIAKRKQEIVISQMVAEKYITQTQADEALTAPLVYKKQQLEVTNTLAPHFALYVKDLLDKKYGEERVIREGFVVKTTLDSKWQKYAEQVVKNQISYLKFNKATNGAVIALDPQTGAIRVMVGSHDWTDADNGKINMTLHPRQPGSSFKPIIYGDAFEKKIITPATFLHDNPIAYGNYKPLDYDKRFRGDVTVRRALANSLNIPAVEVMNKLGVSEGLSAAKKLGITTLGNDSSHYGLSLVLGSGEVPLLEMTSAYGVFADQGIYNKPYAVIEIKNKYGQNVDTKPLGLIASFLSLFNPQTISQIGPTDEPRQVISDDTSYLISSILSDNNARAEVFGGALTISRPAAVKTGTTNDYKDALTIGYTPSLVIGVWVGNNDNTPMDNIAGSLGAAPIWRQLMENFLIGKPLETFIKPASILKIELCQSPNQTTPPTATTSGTEYFIRGTEPKTCPSPTPFPSPTTKPTNSPEPTSQPTNAPQPTQANSPAPTSIPTTSPTGIISIPPLSPLPTQ